MREAEQVVRQLVKFDNGCLVTYRRVEDLKLNAPTGRVALVILSNAGSPSGIRRTLRWLRHRWPRCPITIVGNAGCGEDEMAAREGGALFLTRPVGQEQWAAILNHVLGDRVRIIEK